MKYTAIGCLVQPDSLLRHKVAYRTTNHVAGLCQNAVLTPFSETLNRTFKHPPNPRPRPDTILHPMFPIQTFSQFTFRPDLDSCLDFGLLYVSLSRDNPPLCFLTFQTKTRDAHFCFRCTQLPCLAYVSFVFHPSCTRPHVPPLTSACPYLIPVDTDSYLRIPPVQHKSSELILLPNSNTACLVRLRLRLSHPLASTSPASGSAHLPFTP